MFVAVVILYYLIIYIYDYITLYKQKKTPDTYVNVILSLVSFVVAVLLSLGINIPSPAKPIETLITSLFGR